MGMSAGVVKHIELGRRRKTITVSFTPTGNVAAPEAVDLTQVTNPSFQPGGFFGGLPTKVASLNQPQGYEAEFTIGATLNACSMTIYKGGAAVAAGTAYSAGMLADSFQFDFSGPIGKI